MVRNENYTVYIHFGLSDTSDVRSLGGHLGAVRGHEPVVRVLVLHHQVVTGRDGREDGRLAGREEGQQVLCVDDRVEARVHEESARVALLRRPRDDLRSQL